MEIIDIASLNFDTDKLAQSAVRSREEIDKLSSSITASRKVVRDSQKDVIALTKANDELAKSGEDSSDEFKENAKEIERLNKTISNNTEKLVENESQRRNLNKEQRELNKILDLQTKSQGDNSLAIEQSTTILDQNWTTQKEAFDTGKAMMALRKQLNPAIAEEAALMEKLAARTDEANEFQDQYNTKNEDRTKGIGNYKDAVTDALKESGLFNAVTSAGSSSVGGLTSSLKGGASGFIGLTKAALGFAAIPLIALLTVITGAFLLVKNALSGNEEGTQDLTIAFKPLTGIVTGLLNALKPLGEFLADVLVKTLEFATVAIEKLMDSLEAVFNFLGWDLMAEGIRKTNEAMKEGAEQARELAEAQYELTKAQRENLIVASNLKRISDEQKVIRDDETKSLEERMEAARAVTAADNAMIASKLEIVRQEIRINELLQLQGDTGKEILDQHAQLTAQMQDIEAEQANLERRAQRRTAGIQREVAKEDEDATKKYVDERKKRLEAATKAMESELELFVLHNKGNQDVLEEELDYYKSVQEQKEQILKQQLKSQSISQLEFNTQMEILAIESAEQQAEIVLFYATQRVNEEINTLQDIQSERTRFNNETYEAEQDLIKRINEEKLNNAEAELEAGLISRHDYNDLVLELEAEQFNKLDSIEKEYDEQRLEDRKLARLLEHESILLGMEDEWEEEQELLDFFYEQEEERLEEQRESGLISEENYLTALDNLNKNHATAQMQLDEAVAANKIQLHSDALGDLATIFGKESQAGKFFASAQATMDTYVAANKALAAYPPPFSYIAAGAAIVSGLGNVKKINKTKTQKYTGGYTGDGGMFTRTGYVHAGEVVFSQQDVNSMGGADAVERLRPTSSSYGQMPTGISSNTDNITNWQQIGVILGEQVRQGSERGTNFGIVEANDNAEVRRNASF